MAAHVTVGSYGHVLYGFDLPLPASAGAKIEMTPRYSYEAHVGSVTCVAVSGEKLVSGGTDEMIKVYDLRRGVEHGTLMEHSGTVTCLEFFGSTHLLSGSEDGTVMVWDASTWDCLKVLKGHKGAVDALSIHPSGKLALSAGRDSTLHVWNLVKGRKAYVSKLPAPSREVVWVSTGESYAVVVRNDVLIYATASGDLVRTFALPAAVHSIAFYSSGNRMVAGVNNDKLYVVDTASCEVIHEQAGAHENRVRNVAAADGDAAGEATLFTSSSDGFVKVWRVSEADGAVSCECVGKTETGGRLTCMSVRVTRVSACAARVGPTPTVSSDDAMEAAAGSKDAEVARSGDDSARKRKAGKGAESDGAATSDGGSSAKKSKNAAKSKKSKKNKSGKDAGKATSSS